jgi:hypothetical protein
MDNSHKSLTEISLTTVTVIYCFAAIAGGSFFYGQDIACETRAIFRANVDPISLKKTYAAVLAYFVSMHFLYFGLTRDFLKSHTNKQTIKFKSSLGTDYTPAGIFLQYVGAKARVLTVYPISLFLFVLFSFAFFYCSLK